jgi:hypothetical protein
MLLFDEIERTLGKRIPVGAAPAATVARAVSGALYSDRAAGGSRKAPELHASLE